MTASEDQGGEWESQAQVDACLRETGVTRTQVKRWRRWGLLPKEVIQQPQAYRGSIVLYPVGTCARITAAQALSRKKDRREYVGFRLWWMGFPIGEDYWRSRLRGFARRADKALRFVVRVRVNGARNLPTYGEVKFPSLAGGAISRRFDRGLRFSAAVRDV